MIGRTVAIGDTVRLSITKPCPRCVMMTLPQGELPRDSGIFRAAALDLPPAARPNEACCQDQTGVTVLAGHIELIA